MIGKLKGVVDTLEEDHVILDVHGVGYLVHCSGRTLSALPRAGEAAALFIETHVREDQIRLFGFTSAAERDWFRLLQGIQGIGTKTALAVLSTLSASELTQAIALGDKTTVARAPGVGPRVATRIITELKDKMPGFSASEPLVAQLGGAIAPEQGGAAADAVSALVNLGYGVPQANAAIAAALRGAGEGAKTEVLIRLGLKELAK
ncbi:UNVERIFIED_ORG: Holliday junction DNA helicase RuvA [Xanthobacter viscosus]|jgi:Holliday junction DNA helicase RuvA|uniref:Holliday junction branch migration complex subunit RuvA n=1 Tax=Xanthobacter autotrophicus TaxID=280 RepID=A0A6C1KDP2_XANAU|nr:Holliday junction branch migration protein RuvA [Xanthobacter autotrophicus]TLX42375.1 Holliday junction branch migration protein RuvA [Xanthobacter autotrophicus]